MKNSARLKTMLPAILLLGLGIIGLAAPQLLPADGDRVAVIAPGRDPLQIVAAAGGLAIGGSTRAVFAISAEPGFVDRLYHSGAWLVLRFDGTAGCLQAELEGNQYERS